MRLLPLSQIPLRSLDWLWLHHLAVGQLALLEGDPGMGKSLVTLDLAARVSGRRGRCYFTAPAVRPLTM